MELCQLFESETADSVPRIEVAECPIRENDVFDRGRVLVRMFAVKEVLGMSRTSGGDGGGKDSRQSPPRGQNFNHVL